MNLPLERFELILDFKFFVKWESFQSLFKYKFDFVHEASSFNLFTVLVFKYNLWYISYLCNLNIALCFFPLWSSIVGCLRGTLVGLNL